MSVSAIQIGLHPDSIDYEAPEFTAFAGLTRERLRAANDDNLALLRDAGYEADGCQIDFGETALDTIRAMLGRKRYDAVLIGAGVRLTAGNTLLFESIVNLVHTALPHARFIFNHSAAATPDDIRRHYPDPASTVALDIPRDLEEAAVKNPGNAARPEAAHGPRETR
ncbi:hypothetical protein [Streptomyces rapamycinicus]|uniref:Uncharacterized protein n=2 Tax=Streptomyces rapamycinicus TaxID=1226757 RepID=A0A0A0NSM9_STRRN|nr:hypothetical protein [Streptomyces rapamycinicus]AGP60431.1 hypothetical protein M271_45325 [Streptomyces rapamycinicus NRRL 5491]MBB4788404.1 hypothetical protein [Streptomyces rapamycinicus]RLV72739.1 hypothetical protein D3C57_149470 [Streptomyces rapamycinicus NRRL 5491]UTP35998.1 hypothetical protein LIV37_46060 [Streptomyces rapamycinicus NRRL 5491]